MPLVAVYPSFLTYKSGLPVANRDLFEKAINLEEEIEDNNGRVTYNHVPREENTRADELANQACEEAMVKFNRRGYAYGPPEPDSDSASDSDDEPRLGFFEIYQPFYLTASSCSTLRGSVAFAFFVACSPCLTFDEVWRREACCVMILDRDHGRDLLDGSISSSSSLNISHFAERNVQPSQSRSMLQL